MLKCSRTSASPVTGHQLRSCRLRKEKMASLANSPVSIKDSCVNQHSLLLSTVKKCLKGNCFIFCYTISVLQFSESGTAEGEGLVWPRPHHFFAPPPPLFVLKRKIIKIKKRLETSFFPSIFRYILCIFFNFKRQAFCGAPVLFAVIVPWGRLAP